LHMDILLDHPPRIAGVNRYPFAAGELVGPRSENSCHLCFVVGGHGLVELDGQETSVEPGQLIILPRGRRWSLRDTGQLVVLSVHMRFVDWNRPDGLLGASPSLAEPSPDLGSGVLTKSSAEAWTIAESILATWLGRHPSRNFLLRAQAAALVASLLQPLPGTRKQVRTDHVALVLEWLQWHGRLDITREELERRSGLGRSAFGAAFKAATGLSPTQWLMDRRMAEAHRQLTTSRDAIAAIAARVGFRDPFHFSRCFRRCYGVSPRQTRTLPTARSRNRL